MLRTGAGPGFSECLALDQVLQGGGEHHDVEVPRRDLRHDLLLGLGVEHVVLRPPDQDVDLLDFQPEAGFLAHLLQMLGDGCLALWT